MNGYSALIHMVQASGKAGTRISTELGKSTGYIGAYLSAHKTPGVDVFASIARACGYRLQLIAPDGQVHTIGPDDTAQG